MSIIRIENLTKQYYVRGHPVLVFDNLNLVIGEREFVGIHGPANSGKTTLLHLIAGLEKVNAGRVLIDNVDITQLDDTSLSRFRQQRVGIVSAQSSLLSGHTAAENIEIALLFHQSTDPPAPTAEELLGQVGASEHRQVKATQLSEEARRRILLAKTLIHRPDILLSDALADGLLEQSAGELIHLLRGLARQGLTVLLFTRMLEIACQTDRIVFLQGADPADPPAAE